MNKIQALWCLFKQGQVVAEPTLWKNRQITATVLAGVILAAVNALAAFGYSLPIDVETANAIAAGIIAVINVVLTITTTDKIGIEQRSATTSVVVTEENSDGFPEALRNHYK